MWQPQVWMHTLHFWSANSPHATHILCQQKIFSVKIVGIKTIVEVISKSNLLRHYLQNYLTLPCYLPKLSLKSPDLTILLVRVSLLPSEFFTLFVNVTRIVRRTNSSMSPYSGDHPYTVMWPWLILQVIATIWSIHNFCWVFTHIRVASKWRLIACVPLSIIHQVLLMSHCVYVDVSYFSLYNLKTL